MRIFLAIAACFMGFACGPAQAQFFFRPADLSGAPVTGAEPGILGQTMPEATSEDLRAALVWNLRAALNVAALQCQFEPTLLTLNNYEGVLDKHKAELAASYDRLGAYFRRVESDKRAAQSAFDQFGTRIYSGFSTVSAQLTFCEVAGDIGREARFAQKGTLGDVAARRMRELRKSLVPYGEQQFRVPYQAQLPRMPDWQRKRCWRGDVYRADRCGAVL